MTELIVIAILGIVALGSVAALGATVYHVTKASNVRAAEDSKQIGKLLANIKSLTDAVVTPPHSQTERIEAEQGGSALRTHVRNNSRMPAFDDAPGPDLRVLMPGNKD
jgi:hypothetical protein